MLKDSVRNVLARFGLSLHRKESIHRLFRELDRLRRIASTVPGSNEPPPARATAAATDLNAELAAARAALDWYEERRDFFRLTEDYNARAKERAIVDGASKFGQVDFADLACWIFASSLSNHRVIHQRIDETTVLWRSVKRTAGPILEVGRAAGGSTIAILGASGDRTVVSIDRAPTQPEMTKAVFSRPDVQSRLKLYNQSSREEIAEQEFGMMFIDGDHSYEGVCHDIATFWNCLKSIDGKAPIAVFHDAADNPIGYVPAVKRACDELIGEGRTARVVESWGSMLAVEKLGDLDQDRWYAKEDRGFWKRYAGPGYPVLSPRTIRSAPKSTVTARAKGLVNLLGEENLDDPSWIKVGADLDIVFLEADNPVRFVRETPTVGEHKVEKTVTLGLSSFAVTVFLRPVRRKLLRLSVRTAAGASLAEADFALVDDCRIERQHAVDGARIVDCAFLYGNGFFRCDLSIETSKPLLSAVIAVAALDESGSPRYQGSPDCGFMMNLASVRELR
jgi:Methyltransferase domain